MNPAAESVPDRTAASTAGNAVMRRFDILSPLSDSERLALGELLNPAQWAQPGAVIDREGDAATDVHALLAGIACRHKDLRGGRRQIIGILLPGDLSGDPTGGSRPSDHHVRAMTHVHVVKIPIDRFQDLTARHPGIAKALHNAAVLEGAVQRA